LVVEAVVGVVGVEAVDAGAVLAAVEEACGVLDEPQPVASTATPTRLRTVTAVDRGVMPGTMPGRSDYLLKGMSPRVFAKRYFWGASPFADRRRRPASA
jgi:hypothetical protein